MLQLLVLGKILNDLKHIKCAKYKEGFSKCEVCSQYEQESLKQLHVADMLNLDA